MTIVEYISSTRIGGAETYLLRLVEDLRNNGHRVIVVTRRRTALNEVLAAQGIETYNFHRGGKWNFGVFVRLCALLRREKVDLIHTHLFSAHHWGTLAARFVGIPLVAHVHCTGEAVPALHRAKAILAVSSGVRDDLIAYGIGVDKIFVRSLGIDVARFENAPSRTVAREQLSLSSKAFVIAVVASLSERKGHRFLLQAIARMQDQIGAVELIFCGEGDQLAPLQLLAEELGLSQKVRFLGFRDDVETVFSACDALVLPSLQEGFPLVLAEAMAARRPVVVSDLPGLAELVQDGQNGLLFEPGNVTELAKVLKNLASDISLREKLADAGYSWVESGFNDADLLADTREFLMQVAQLKKDARKEAT